MDLGKENVDYHGRMAVAANEIAQILLTQGLESSLEQARTAASSFHHDYRFLMAQAAGVLFRTGDPAKQESGLQFMAWEAEHFPSPIEGDNIAHDAEHDARYEESRAFAGRCFAISLIHFRNTAAKEGFTPNAGFFEHFNAAAGRISESCYGGLYRVAITEFAPFAIAAAINHQPADPAEGRDQGKYEIDEMLLHAHGVLRKSDPALAELAYSLITDEPLRQIDDELERDRQLTEAFTAGDFTITQHILGRPDGHFIQTLWNPLLARLKQGDEISREWGNAVLNTILAAQPDYFDKYAYADMFYGDQVGSILGLLDRRDIIETMLHPGVRPTETGKVASGVAAGYGLQHNEEGLAYLLSQISHYSASIIDIIRKSFELASQGSAETSRE